MIIHQHSSTKPGGQSLAPGHHQQSPLPNFPLPGPPVNSRRSQPNVVINYSDWSDHPSRLPSLHEVCNPDFSESQKPTFYTPTTSHHELPLLLPPLCEVPGSQRARSASRSRRSTSHQRHLSAVRHPRGYSSSTSKLVDVSEGTNRSILDDLAFTATLEIRPAPRGSARGSRDRSCSAHARRIKGKERRPWTDAETDDLFRAVSKHGIGKWTKIHKDPAFHFDNRSPTDLKDRFRTCAPPELLQIYDSRLGSCSRQSSEAPNPSMSAPNLSVHPELSNFPGSILNPVSAVIDETTVHPSPRESTPAGFQLHQARNPSQPPQNRVAFPNDLLNNTTPESTKSPSPPSMFDDADKRRRHRKTMGEILRLGIVAPFKRTSRRERRWFTEQEDSSILNGLLIYGPQWSRIRNDYQFPCLAERQSTDLRDRIRNKYPELFAVLSAKPARSGGAKHSGGTLGEGGVLDVDIINTIRDLLRQLGNGSDASDSPTSHRTQHSAEIGHQMIKQEERESMSPPSSASPTTARLW